MFEVLIFVCSIGLSPSQCQKDTALRVFRGPPAANEMACGMQSQAYLAEVALPRKMDRTYIKIGCTRSKPAGVIATRRPAEPQPAAVSPSPSH